MNTSPPAKSSPPSPPLPRPRGLTDLYELILVDNASTDGSTDYFRSVPGARVIVNNKNVGFARGCNPGIAIARGGPVPPLNNEPALTPALLFPPLAAAPAHSTL